MSAYMDKIRSEERERGKEEGKIEGKLEEKKETALKMHNQGYPDNEVASIFETDIETIREWIYGKPPVVSFP